MKITSPPGTRIIFAYPKNGHSEDQKLAQEHLEVGNTYTVKKIDARAFHSRVFLEEVPDVAFNTVLFKQEQE